MTGLSRQRLLTAALAAFAAIAILYVGIPSLAGLDDTWALLGRGDPWWLLAAMALELGSFLGYVVLFHAVFGRESTAVDWRTSGLITFAGVAASRLLGAGGVGGIVLTVWALRRAGVPRHRVATQLTAFLVLLYGVYMAALLLGGLGLRTGLLHGPAPFALTVVPAIGAAFVIVAALLAAVVPDDVERRLGRLSAASGVTGRVARTLARVGAVVGEGVRDALALLRTRDLALLGAVAWWAFDVGVLWACLQAFGGAPSAGVVTMAYFVGTLGNLLPIPGGVGGVEGGMIGALVAFDVPAGNAVVGVLAYRAFSLWLPTIPGIAAYLQLTRRARMSERAAAQAMR